MSKRFETSHDLWEAAQEVCGDVPPEVFYSVCNWEGPYDVHDLKEVVQALNEMGYKRTQKPAKDAEEGKTLPEVMKAQAVLLVGEAAVKDLVTGIRQKLFQTSEPPFPQDPGGALAWLQQQEEAQGDDYTVRVWCKRHHLTWLYERAKEEGENLSQTWGVVGAGVVEEEDLTLHYEYADAGRLVRYSVPVVENSPLGHLKRAALGLASMLNVDEEQATAYILNGLLPTRPPIVAFGGGSGVLFPEVQSITIVINHPDVDPETVKEEYTQLRYSCWGVTRTASVNEQAAELVRFVALEAEGLSWEKRRKLWNKQYADRRFESTDEMRMAYRRAADRVLPLPPGTQRFGDRFVMGVEDRETRKRIRQRRKFLGLE